MPTLPSNIETREPLFLKAGVTPGFNIGDNKYTNVVTNDNSSLTGWDITATIRTFGQLDPESEYTITGEVLQLTNSGYHIQANEVWVLEFQPKAIGIPIVSPAVDYSNGYSIAPVLNAILGRRRWRQPTRSDFPLTLESDLVWGLGDTYSPVFESEHGIVDAYNVWVNQSDANITSSNFSQKLRNMAIDNVLKCLNNVFTKRENLEKKLLFERFGRQDYINLNEGKFVGVRIIPARSFDKTCQIDNIALLFDRNVTFNMYLFHDTAPNVPIHTFSVSALANQQVVIPLDYLISYSGIGKKSGVFYFGYFQNDLGAAQGINEIVETFNQCYNFGICPIELNNPSGHMIDVNYVSFTLKTHGFNIQMSCFRDFTQIIVDNAHLFDNLLGLQMAADVIEMIANSTRANKDQRITAEATNRLYMDLNLAQTTDERPFSTGLKTRIYREVAKVKEGFFSKRKTASITHDTDQVNVYGVPPPLNDAFKY